MNINHFLSRVSPLDLMLYFIPTNDSKREETHYEIVVDRLVCSYVAGDDTVTAYGHSKNKNFVCECFNNNGLFVMHTDKLYKNVSKFLDMNPTGNVGIRKLRTEASITDELRQTIKEHFVEHYVRSKQRLEKSDKLGDKTQIKCLAWVQAFYELIRVEVAENIVWAKPTRPTNGRLGD